MTHCFANFYNGLIGLELLTNNFIFNYFSISGDSKGIYK